MIGITLLLVICGFFTASEIAFVACDLVKLRYWVSKKRKGAKFALNALKNKDKFLVTVLVGTNLVIVGLGVTASNAWHTRLPGAVITLLTALLVFMFGEVLPKSIVLRFKEQFVLIFVKPYTIIYWLFYPIIFVVEESSIALLKFFKARTAPLFHRFTKEELQVAAESALSLQEQGFISNLLDFRGKTLKDVMIPRHKIQSAPVGLSIEELSQIASESGHSRIPVYQSNIDEILGTVWVRDLLTAESVKDIIKECKFIQEAELIEPLFDKLRGEGSFFAIVRDKNGKTSGLITMEDILEELFGEIEDEYDKI